MKFKNERERGEVWHLRCISTVQPAVTAVIKATKSLSLSFSIDLWMRNGVNHMVEWVKRILSIFCWFCFPCIHDVIYYVFTKLRKEALTWKAIYEFGYVVVQQTHVNVFVCSILLIKSKIMLYNYANSHTHITSLRMHWIQLRIIFLLFSIHSFLFWESQKN